LIQASPHIPDDLHTLAEFREWVLNTDTKELGRVDYIDGAIEVEMSPEDLDCHGAVKGAIYAALFGVVQCKDLGLIYVDGARVSMESADLSLEPDIGFISWNSLESGRVKRTPNAGSADRFVELNGPPDLIVEVVSDSSVAKETRRFPGKFFTAKVEEYWLVDARGPEISFQIQRRGSSSFESVDADAEGFQHSQVFSHEFRLTRTRGRMNVWITRLEVRPET